MAKWVDFMTQKIIMYYHLVSDYGILRKKREEALLREIQGH